MCTVSANLLDEMYPALLPPPIRPKSRMMRKSEVVSESAAALRATLEFDVRASTGVVIVGSDYRLQFDNKPQTTALKRAIGDAVAELSAGPAEMLEAIYTSASADLVDAENVLLYNVGTHRFAPATRLGLRFERIHSVPACEPPRQALH